MDKRSNYMPWFIDPVWKYGQLTLKASELEYINLHFAHVLDLVINNYHYTKLVILCFKYCVLHRGQPLGF